MLPQCCKFGRIRPLTRLCTQAQKSDAHIWLCVPSRLPSVHPSTTHCYQHADYLVLNGKHGKAVLPGNDCIRGQITSADLGWRHLLFTHSRDYLNMCSTFDTWCVAECGVARGGGDVADSRGMLWRRMLWQLRVQGRKSFDYKHATMEAKYKVISLK